MCFLIPLHVLLLHPTLLASTKAASPSRNYQSCFNGLQRTARPGFSFEICPPSFSHLAGGYVFQQLVCLVSKAPNLAFRLRRFYAALPWRVKMWFPHVCAWSHCLRLQRCCCSFPQSQPEELCLVDEWQYPLSRSFSPLGSGDTAGHRHNATAMLMLMLKDAPPDSPQPCQTACSSPGGIEGLHIVLATIEAVLEDKINSNRDIMLGYSPANTKVQLIWSRKIWS